MDKVIKIVETLNNGTIYTTLLTEEGKIFRQSGWYGEWKETGPYMEKNKDRMIRQEME